MQSEKSHIPNAVEQITVEIIQTPTSVITSSILKYYLYIKVLV